MAGRVSQVVQEALRSGSGTYTGSGILDGTSPTGAWSFSRNLLTSFSSSRYTATTTVSALNDQTGNARHFVQAAGTNQPTLTTAAPASRACGAFDGNDVFAASALSNFIAAGSGYIIVSAIFDAISAGTADYLNSSPLLGDAGGYVGIFAGSSTTIRSYNYDGTQDYTAASTIATATPYVCEWRHEGGNLYFRLNGGSWSAATASGNTSDTSGTFRLGSGATTGGLLVGKIFEAATYSTIPSTAQQDAISVDFLRWLTDTGVVTLRSTQVVTESIRNDPNDPTLRASQVVTESIRNDPNDPTLRTSQVVLEVLRAESIILPEVRRIQNVNTEKHWPLIVGSSAIPLSVTVSTPYTGFTANRVGGVAPITYSLVGTWPTGISINSSTGVVSGTPTVEGSYTGLSVRATDDDSATADLTPFTMTVATAGDPYWGSVVLLTGGNTSGKSSWSTTDKTSNVVLSGANLTATASVSGAGGIRGVHSKTTGKYYWEVTLTQLGNVDTRFGIANASANLSTVAGTSLVNACGVAFAGGVVLNGSGTGITVTPNLPAVAHGQVCFALDMTSKLFWIRSTATGAWNAGGSADPATGVGGINITSIVTGGIFPLFAFTGPGTPAESVTANFGSAAFAGAVPSGFTAGWPDPLGVTGAADASTTFIDESLYARTLTPAGAAQIDTADSKFGGSSLLFNGSTDAVRAADAAELNLGSGKFTIEAFVKANGSLGGPRVILWKWGASGAQSFALWTNGTDLCWSVSTDGSNSFADMIGSPGLTSASTWYHVAVDYDGTKYRMYRNGTMIASSTTARTIFTSTSAVSLASQSNTINNLWNGWMDEVRITKGIARYASDSGFTVPTTEFPRTGPTKILDGTSPTGAWSMSRDLLSTFVGSTRYTTTPEAPNQGVNQLTDQTGNARHFTQGAPSFYPFEVTAGPNNRTCADFDGSADHLIGNAATTLNNLITASSGYIVVSFMADAFTTNNSPAYQNSTIFSDPSDYITLSMKTGGTLMAMNWDTNEDTTTGTITTGTPYVAEWRHEGGNIYLRINGGTETSVASGNTGSLSGVLWLGLRSSYYANMKLFEIASWSAVPSLATRNAIVADFKAWVGA